MQRTKRRIRQSGNRSDPDTRPVQEKTRQKPPFIDIGTVREGIVLYNDGSHGDTIGDDQVFERDYAIVSGDSILSGDIVGHYVDKVGNISVSKLVDFG